MEGKMYEFWKVFSDFAAVVLTGAEFKAILRALSGAENGPLTALTGGEGFVAGGITTPTTEVRPRTAVFLASEAGGDGHWGHFLQGPEIFLRFEDALARILERRKDYAIRLVTVTRQDGEQLEGALQLLQSDWQPGWKKVYLGWSYQGQSSMTGDEVRLEEIL